MKLILLLILALIVNIFAIILQSLNSHTWMRFLNINLTKLLHIFFPWLTSVCNLYAPARARWALWRLSGMRDKDVCFRSCFRAEETSLWVYFFLAKSIKLWLVKSDLSLSTRVLFPGIRKIPSFSQSEKAKNQLINSQNNNNEELKPNEIYPKLW